MKAQKVTLVAVSEVSEAENGKPYFAAYFKLGTFGKSVVRTFWGKADNSDKVIWDRVSPEELTASKGQDLSGEVFIEAVNTEPTDFVNPETGEVHTVTSRTIVRFADETQEQAARRSGVVLRQERQEASAHLLESPGAFQVIGLNGKY